MARLELEHIVPISKGGTSDESNLWLSCPLCNASKGSQSSCLDPTTGQMEVPFNPRLQKWGEHFRWTDEGLRIVGRTPTGRATVALLHLDDDPDAIIVRGYRIEAGWHPPQDD